MQTGRVGRLAAAVLAVAVLMAAAVGSQAQSAPQGCRILTLAGEATAGHEWRQAIGAGWVLRMVPLTGSYSGWDLVVDRAQPAGYPDALLVATPPWGSISEREIGTSFGLRAQDAIGWNPRSFRFLTSERALAEAQKLLPQALDPPGSAASQRAQARLMELAAHAATGRLRIEDARIAPGIADAAPFAQGWALAAARMPHQETPAAGGKPTARGAIDWLRFTVTLWLPADWPALPPALPRTLPGVAQRRRPCQQ